MLLARTSDGYQYVFDRPVRLLVVDDDPIMREFAVAQFSQPGATLVTAEDGDAAWDILEREDTPFDLVLSDLEMPRCSGFGLVERMRRSPRHATIPVVVITGRDDLFAIDRAYEVGATTFVTKPVNWRQLGYQLRYVLRTAAMEAEVRVARDTAQRVAALRENMLGLLQHVTRTPLNAILGYGEMVRADLASPQAQERADAVVMAARDLEDTLSRVFLYSQLSTGTLPFDFETASPVEAVEAALAGCRARAEAKGVALTARLTGTEIRARVDLRLLTLAVKELVLNAIAASPAGSWVTVEMELSGGRIVLRIRDEGSGLPPAALECLDRPFLSNRDLAGLDGSRLGFGLPIARSILETHAGSLGVEDSDSGSCVTLTLPAQPSTMSMSVGAAA